MIDFDTLAENLARTMLAVLGAFFGALPGTYFWVNFADQMSKYGKGWPYVGEQTVLMSIPIVPCAYGLSWFLSWVHSERAPRWWVTLPVSLFLSPFLAILVIYLATELGWRTPY